MPVLPLRYNRAVAIVAAVLFMWGGAHSASGQRAEENPASPTLRLTHPMIKGPAPIGLRRVRFGGVTDPGAVVWVNGEEVRVWPNGVFAGLAPLQDGENTLEFVAVDAEGKTNRRSIKVTVPQPGGFEWPKLVEFDEPFAYAAESDLELYTTWDRDHPFVHVFKGGRVAVTGQHGDSLRIELAPNLIGWARADLMKRAEFGGWVGTDVIPSPTGEQDPLAPARLSAMDGSSPEGAEATWIMLELRSRALPFRVIESPGPGGDEFGAEWSIEFFGANLGSFWQRMEMMPALADLTARQESGERVFANARLRPDFALSGYAIEHHDHGVLSVKLNHRQFDPSPEPLAPLAGWTIALCVGHGSSNMGAIGNTGLTEYQANVWIARLLETEIQRLGGETIQIAPLEPHEMTLADRVTVTRASEADLFVSIHNDSVGLSTDPLAARGSSIFYSHLGSRRLAESIYARMRDVDSAEAPRGVFRRGLYVTRRITHIPSVLVECRFMSHPEDEADLLDPDRRAVIARSIVQGIVDYTRPERE